ncbi:unnamed protein product [Symbiodinium sp. KB8]|nr:unnamed protein product [Symbiodinium sp. KB8]
MAVHLLSRKVDVAAVRTCGAPHVFIPPEQEQGEESETSTLWKQLCSMSQHWVHDWDPVPRLPLGPTCLADALPRLKIEPIKRFRIGIAVGRLWERFDVEARLSLRRRSLPAAAAHPSACHAAIMRALWKRLSSPYASCEGLTAACGNCLVSQMSERQSDFKCVIGVIFLLILIFYIIRDLIQLGGCAVACLIVLAAALPARAVLVNNIASIVQVRRDWKQKWLTLLTLLLLKTVLLLLKTMLPNELEAGHVNSITKLLADGDDKVRKWTEDLLNHRMPGRLLGESFSEFLVHLRSTNSGTADASRRLFEQKISAEILAQHFEKIVPPLLADPNLQLWALDLIIAHLAADGYLRLKERSLDLLKEQLPSVIGEDHVDSIMPLLASKDSKVRDWAVHLLNERMPDALFIARFNELLVHLDKGAIRRLFERKISSEILVEHFDQIVPLLASSDWQVRLWTVKLLQIRSPTALLVEHQEELVSLLSDPSGQVQRETVSLLERMPNGLICKHYNKLLAPVRSSDPEIRCASRKLLEKQISTEVLEEDFHEIVPPLLADSELQSWSFGILTGRIPPKHHGDLIELIIVLLRREQPWSRQGEALEFLKAQLPEVLGPEHVRKIAAFLNNSECQVKRWTLDLLHEQTPPTALAEHGGRIVMLLDDEDSSVRGTASALVFKIGLSSNMDPSIMGEFAERLAELEQSFSKPFDLPQLMSKLPALLVAATRKEDIASWQDAKGNTWLHLAAEAGHVEACEALVDQVGLPLREKNKAGDEPLALSANREVDRFLRSRIHFRETRFGYGNAFEEMMQDERQVSEVAWYTVPLPGMAGNLGGLHSFLVVTVSGSSGAAGINHGAKRYVLEKAAGSFAKDAHQKHGVFIGSQDLSSNLKSVDGQKQKKQLELRHGSLRVGLKMKELYEEAHSMGPYDVASSNCHHAVQKVFNHCCAREEDKEVRPPNEWLATLGAMFGGLFTSSTSGAGGSNSDVASANSEVASGSHPADRPNGFARSVDLSCDVFAEVAASLSLAVYEKDPAIVLRPQEAGAVSIRNKLGRRVILHDHTTQSRHRVDADRRESLQTAGADKIFVDVDTVGWIPGLCSHRRLARRQAVWSGHAYDLSTDFRNEVVLQEVVSLAPSQAVDVLHTAQKSGSTSPVQWFLARSDNALYVAFRGTDDVQDFAIDVAAVPDYTRFEEHGIGVHSGIAHALEQRGDGIRHVVNDVLRALKEHRQPGERLVLCGHSLGGGYAQVMAVHLLSRELEVAAVRTFGAPHVLVPPSREEDRQKLWCTLDSITQHWVHDWDPVPRLPLCKTWLTDVLPKLKQEVVTGLRVGIAQKYIQALQRHYDETRAKLLERYDIAGEVVLVSKATSVALRASEGSAASKELLGEKPPESVMTRSKLFAYHSMEDYLQIAHKLTAQLGRPDAQLLQRLRLRQGLALQRNFQQLNAPLSYIHTTEFQRLEGSTLDGLTLNDTSADAAGISRSMFMQALRVVCSFAAAAAKATALCGSGTPGEASLASRALSSK